MTARTNADAGPTAGHDPARDGGTARPVSAALIATVVLLTGIAPLATDMYVRPSPTSPATSERRRRRSS